MIKFTVENEWINAADTDVAVVGITHYAQQQLGEVVFVELPKIGTVFAQGDETGVIESVKAAASIYTPVSGEIVAVNADVVDNPALVNDDPEGEGWLFKIKLSDPSQLDALMDADAYMALLV
ncbi:glycine cleavage system protein GcvH [Sphaerotilus sp.]|uniref:glycine cleavage system protein GcvH n=1 Tax=Sphaerotilus sp. TaxID=2093942 RepID=UPI00286DFFDD|nr:glycine cleavage system protein GcvH [Sphaerotilus sp.]